MAEFDPAVTRTLMFEGGYSTNPKDPGGETLFGISRRNQPNWSGWQRVDQLKGAFAGDQLRNILNADQPLLTSAKQYYARNFWNFNDIKSQEVANKVFDMSVNMGTETAAKLLQRAAGVKADGVIGPATLAAVNSLDGSALAAGLRQASTQHYQNLVDKNPNLRTFLPDWLKRAGK